MMLADVPAVLLGEVAANRLPIKLVNRIAAAAFVALGVWCCTARDLAGHCARLEPRSCDGTQAPAGSR